MSESVEVKKEFTMQVDYVRCKECGKDLDFVLSSDEYGDLQIDVDVTECDCHQD